MSSKCHRSCVLPQSESAPFVSHNIEEKRYKWEPKGVPFTQHFGGKMNVKPKTNASPPANFATGPERPLDVTYCKEPSTKSAPFVAHMLKPCPVFHQPPSTPYTQHFFYQKVKVNPGEGQPPSGFGCPPLALKSSFLCKGRETKSAPYVSHVIDPCQKFHVPQSTPYTQHFSCCPKTEKPGEAVAPYIAYKRDPHTWTCEQHNDNIYCKKNGSAPFGDHDINPKKVISCGNLSYQNLFPLPTYFHSSTAPPYVLGGYKDKTKKKGCRPEKYCETPSGGPYGQHILKLYPKTPSIIGAPYAQHASQKYVKRDAGGGGPPALSGVNTMFQTKKINTGFICEEDDDKQAIYRKACYNLGAPFAQHGKYPNEKSDKDDPFVPIVCDKEDDSSGCALASGKLLCCPAPKPYSTIKNSRCPRKKCKKPVIEPVPSDRPVVYQKPDVPFGVVQNLGLCQGEPIPVVFSAIHDKVGLGVQKTSRIYNPCTQKTTKVGCPYTKSLLRTQGKNVPFGAVMNNPHKLYSYTMSFSS